MSTSEKKAALIDLAGTMAHELNNIFTAVVGNLSLLNAEAPGAPTQTPIEDVLRAAHRGIVLSRKLQAFAGRQHLKRQPVDLNRLVEATVRNLSREKLASIEIGLDLSHEAPVVLADEERLAETIREVIDNALAAILVDGNILIETRLRSQPRDGQVSAQGVRYAVIAVTDTGMGMPAEVAGRVFDPLFTTKTPGITAGWGLSSCEGFVRQSGGHMTLTTKSGAGTRVEIHLPASESRTGSIAPLGRCTRAAS